MKKLIFILVLGAVFANAAIGGDEVKKGAETLSNRQSALEAATNQ